MAFVFGGTRGSEPAQSCRLESIELAARGKCSTLTPIRDGFRMRRVSPNYDSLSKKKRAPLLSLRHASSSSSSLNFELRVSLNLRLRLPQRNSCCATSESRTARMLSFLSLWYAYDYPNQFFLMLCSPRQLLHAV